MQKRIKLDPRVLAFPVSSTSPNPVQLAIGYLDFWVTAINVQFVLSKTDSGSVTVYQDWMARAIAGITISDGGRSYVAATGSPDIRPLYWGVRCRHQARFRPPDWVAGTQVFSWDLPLVFSPEPQLYDDETNWWDPRAAIQPSAGLQMSINWNVAGSIATNASLTASKTYAMVTYYGVNPERGEEDPKWYPAWQTLNYAPTAAWANLESIYPMNPGSYYRRTHQIITKGVPDGHHDVRDDGYIDTLVSDVTGILAPATPTASAVTEAGSTLANVAYHFAVAARNSSGSTTATVDAGAITPTASQAVRIAIAQVTGATSYDIFLSTAAAPLLVGRITEAQRATGDQIISAVGVTSARAGATVAGTIDVGIVGTGIASTSASITAQMTLSGNISEVGVVTADSKRPIYMKLPTAAREAQSAFSVADDNTYDAIYCNQTLGGFVGVPTATYGASSIQGPYNPGVVSWDYARSIQLDPTDLDAPVFGVSSLDKWSQLKLGYTVDTVANTPNALIFNECYEKY